jgi:parvulin-like peptidyl-prolyl isomerase
MNIKHALTSLFVATAVAAVSQSVSVRAQTQRTPPGPTRPAATTAPAPVPPTAQPKAPAEETSVKGGETVARVGTADVTADEVRAAVSFLDARQRAALARDPALLSQTVRAILANRLVLKEALAKKWDQQPPVVAQLARARENLIVETYLQSITAPPETFPSDAEIKAVYDANASTLLVPRRFQLAQILVGLGKDADKAAEEAARKKLDDVVNRLKQPGADFAALARSQSDEAASAERDGEIGWAAEPDLNPDIRKQIVGLAKGGVTDPVRLEDGWHVLKLIDTEAAHTRPLAEVKDALIQRIRAERAEANRRAYIAELFKQNPPVINEIALSKLFDGNSGATPAR